MGAENTFPPDPGFSDSTSGVNTSLHMALFSLGTDSKHVDVSMLAYPMTVKEEAEG